MFADQSLGRLVHALCVESFVDTPGAIPVQRRTLGPIENQVVVAARRRRESGMKAVIDRLRPDDADVIGQIAVSAEHPPAATAFATGVEVHDLTGRVYAGIGASCADKFDGFVRDPGQSLFDTRLDALTVALTLPTVVRRSVVL